LARSPRHSGEIVKAASGTGDGITLNANDPRESERIVMTVFVSIERRQRIGTEIAIPRPLGGLDSHKIDGPLSSQLQR
jgi:hypothetical protein